MTTTIEPGQTWKLWVYGDAYRETLHVTRVEDDWASGRTADGEPFTVGLARLRDAGELTTNAR